MSDCMSEKRFTLNLMKKPSEIEMDGKMISKYDVVRLLNEQQATIQSLQTELELVSGAKLFSRRELERKVKEQQATIRKLQDLCGESDSENAKLRQEIKKLQRQIDEKSKTKVVKNDK